MGRFKTSDVEHWRGVLKEHAASGLSMAGYCREHGLRTWQVYEWNNRLRDSESTPFIKVDVSSAEVPVQPEPHRVQSSGIELHHRRGWSLMVEPGFDATHLRRVLRVLEQEL
jgi:hypothetical protein